jgi:response regulator RpfG family c-di-GMP phosphodiesterase
MNTILLIDDDIGPLQYLVDIFEMHYNVVTADNIDVAISKLTDEEIYIDLIVSDWHLGNDSTAQDIFKFLKESTNIRYRNIPVVVVSSDEDNKHWVERQGAIFVLKPASPKMLLNVVAEKLTE